MRNNEQIATALVLAADEAATRRQLLRESEPEKRKEVKRAKEEIESAWLTASMAGGRSPEEGSRDRVNRQMPIDQML